jgi:hypothetical protein
VFRVDVETLKIRHVESYVRRYETLLVAPHNRITDKLCIVRARYGHADRVNAGGSPLTVVKARMASKAGSP